jgi:hypothetical protein
MVGAGACATLVAVFAAVLILALVNPSVHGDSRGLSMASQRVVDCVREGRLFHCDAAPPGAGTGTVRGNVGDFPLLQYIPATAMRAVGLTTDTTVHLLIAINALAFVGIVGLVWLTASRLCAPVWPPLLAAALIASPLLWYAKAAYGEELAALCVVSAIAVVALRAPAWLIIFVVAVACLSKETHPPFVFVLASLTALAVAKRPWPLIAQIAVGCVVGVLANAAFNIFRFGSIINTGYLDQASNNPTSSTAMRIFGALWFSPNDGILWFWPAAVAILLVLAVGANSRIARRTQGPRAALAGWAILALFAINLVGLAMWWAPFGGVSWGPRLSFPLLPAMLLASAVACAERATPTLVAVLRGRWIWVLLGAITLLAIPLMGVLFSPTPVAPLLATDAVCTGATVDTDRTSYYRCLVHRAWAGQSVLLHSAAGARTAWGFVATSALVVSIILLVLLARVDAARAGRDSPCASAT